MALETNYILEENIPWKMSLEKKLGWTISKLS